MSKETTERHWHEVPFQHSNDAGNENTTLASSLCMHAAKASDGNELPLESGS
jgi:hypothetical protein